MNLTPTWRMPITFTRDDWRVLVTYGLVSAELVLPSANPTTGQRPEFGRLHDLGNELTKASSALAGRGKDELLSDPTVWARVEAEADSLDPLREFRTLIAPAVKLIDDAVSGDRAAYESASPASPLLEDGSTIAAFVQAYGPPLAPEPFIEGTRTVWGLSAANLAQRTAVELFDLFTHHPPLRQCSLCARVFAPSGNESNCRWHFWPCPTSVGDRPIELCNESKRFVVDAAERQAHRKEYQRLHTRLRRARERFETAVQTEGPRSPKAREARDAVRSAESEYGSFERRAPGLKPDVSVDVKDLRREEDSDG